MAIKRTGKKDGTSRYRQSRPKKRDGKLPASIRTRRKMLAFLTTQSIATIANTSVSSEIFSATAIRLLKRVAGFLCSISTAALGG